MYLAVYHTHRPSFRRSSVHFTFGEPDQPSPTSSPPAPSAPVPAGPNNSRSDTVPKLPSGPPSPLQYEPKCVGQPKGTSCWMELPDQPGCYVWNSSVQPDKTVTWTGGCVEGLAQGTGTLKWVWDGGKRTVESTGLLREGKRHGQWVLRDAYGNVFEGPYVEGTRHGQWVWRMVDGNVFEGPYMEGEGPYVEGTRHGQWVFRFRDGSVWEGPFVEGKEHGRWVIRRVDGSTEVTIYNRGEIVDN